MIGLLGHWEWGIGSIILTVVSPLELRCGMVPEWLGYITSRLSLMGILAWPPKNDKIAINDNCQLLTHYTSTLDQPSRVHRVI